MNSNDLVFTDYQIFKEKHFTAYQKMGKKEVKLLREADIICALNINKYIKGLMNGHKNLLVSNFFSLLFGTINEANLWFVDIGNTGTNLRSSGDVNNGSAYITFGTGTGASGFSSYALASRNTALEGATGSPYLIISSNEGRSRLVRATAGPVYEVGIYQNVFNAGGGGLTSMWARTVPSESIPANKTVYYDIVFKPPFTHNMTRIIHALLTEANVDGAVDIAGSTFALRANDISNGVSRRVFLGTNTTGLDHTIAVPTNPYEIDNQYAFTYSYGSYYNHAVLGSKKLDVDITIGEVFLVGPYFDSGGGTRNVAIVRFPVSPAVSKKAGDYVSAYILLYASA
jgi:hypothetical protein